MNQEFVRNPYNYDSDAVSTETGLLCTDESLTEQQFLEESDINYIAEKFMKTGMIANVTNMPSYGDFEGIFDFQSAMNIITKARQEFMALPAKLRNRFENDPQQLLDFLDDPNNRAEAARLGLIPEDDTITPAPTNQGDDSVTKPTDRSNPQGKPKATTRPRRTESPADQDTRAESSRSQDPQDAG